MIHYFTVTTFVKIEFNIMCGLYDFFGSLVPIFISKDIIYLCEKCYKPITVQFYIDDYVGWVPRLTFLDLPTNWTCERALRMELIHT